MNWTQISNISSVVTIASAFFSGWAWYKTRNYYSKIAKNNSFEKLSFSDKSLADIRNLYKDINKFHHIVNGRSKNHQKIIDNHLEIENKLNEVRLNIPSKYENIIKSIKGAIEQIQKIDSNNLYFEKNNYFDDLGVYLSNIEDGSKVEKEKIRGF